MRSFVPVATLALASTANAFFLAGSSRLTVQRLDPIINPNAVSGHAHFVIGGSNFGKNVTTASLRRSTCTSFGIEEDKSNYWFPQLYFWRKDGTFTSVNGGMVAYYLFSDSPGSTKAFPDDFRMISGDPTLRTYTANSYAQQAVTFLCLDFSGTSVRYNQLPTVQCPSGIRAELNFPSCWDGKNLDSHDHKSHVAFPSEGPDKGTCTDPKFPVTLPRIFSEIYFSAQDFDSIRGQAMNPQQPFVFAHGDDTGYGYHGDFYMGWKEGVLQNVIDKCSCTSKAFGDPTCCASQGVYTINKNTNCHITNTWDEQTTGTVPKLPGNNPVQHAGKTATTYPNNYQPPELSPVYAYMGDTAPSQGKIIAAGHNIAVSSPNPSPLVRVAAPDTPTPTPQPDSEDDCGDPEDPPAHPSKMVKKHHRRMHNAAFGNSL